MGVEGSLMVTEEWTVQEFHKFVLGLFVFDKDMNRVRKLVESKSMGKLLRFYYGPFCSLNARSKRREWRMEQASSRTCSGGMTDWKSIFGAVKWHNTSSSKKRKRESLLQMSKDFKANKLSLEDLVSVLTDTIPIPSILETIGIQGCGFGPFTSFPASFAPASMDEPAKVKSSLRRGKRKRMLTAKALEAKEGGYFC